MKQSICDVICACVSGSFELTTFLLEYAFSNSMGLSGNQIFNYTEKVDQYFDQLLMQITIKRITSFFE